MQVRQRAKSPVGRKTLFVGDVSGARKAGNAEVQENQRPYLNKFVKTLELKYPKNTRIGSPQPKVGLYLIPVYCFGDADYVAIGNAVKGEFPNSKCVPKGGGEYHWQLPYVQPQVPKQWGAIIFWSVFILFLSTVGYAGFQLM